MGDFKDKKRVNMLISRSVDLDIPPDMRLTSQYKATLGHKACHDFAKKNAAFQ